MPGPSEAAARVLVAEIRVTAFPRLGTSSPGPGCVPVKSRRDPQKAIGAVAASLLTAAYSMLRDGVEVHDLGDQYFTQHDKARLTTRLLQRLRDLGVEAEVKNAA